MEIVLVEWVDSRNSETGWLAKSHAKEFGLLAHCSTVGFVLNKDDEKVVLAFTDAGEVVNSVFAIPKSCILSIQKLVPDVV